MFCLSLDLQVSVRLLCSFELTHAARDVWTVATGDRCRVRAAVQSLRCVFHRDHPPTREVGFDNPAASADCADAWARIYHCRGQHVCDSRRGRRCHPHATGRLNDVVGHVLAAASSFPGHGLSHFWTPSADASSPDAQEIHSHVSPHSDGLPLGVGYWTRCEHLSRVEPDVGEYVSRGLRRASMVVGSCIRLRLCCAAIDSGMDYSRSSIPGRWRRSRAKLAGRTHHEGGAHLPSVCASNARGCRICDSDTCARPGLRGSDARWRSSRSVALRASDWIVCEHDRFVVPKLHPDKGPETPSRGRTGTYSCCVPSRDSPDQRLGARKQVSSFERTAGLGGRSAPHCTATSRRLVGGSGNKYAERCDTNGHFAVFLR